MIARPKAGQSNTGRSRPISRILSTPPRVLRRGGAVTIIPLGPGLLAGSSDLPGDNGRAVRSTWRLASPDCCRPIWSCSVRGFACHPCCHGRGALLPHLFTIARRTLRPAVGCVFSVPLSFGLPRPGVTRRTALRSSDFPLAFASCGASTGDHLAHCDGVDCTSGKHTHEGQDRRDRQDPRRVQLIPPVLPVLPLLPYPSVSCVI